MINISSHAFPLTPGVKDEGGLPWGCMVQPLARPEMFLTDDALSVFQKSKMAMASSVARCNECFAYISPFCSYQYARYWYCCLCGNRNNLLGRDIHEFDLLGVIFTHLIFVTTGYSPRKLRALGLDHGVCLS